MKISERQLRKIIRESLDEISFDLANSATNVSSDLSRWLYGTADMLKSTCEDLESFYNRDTPSSVIRAADELGFGELAEKIRSMIPAIKAYAEKKSDQANNLARGTEQKEWDSWPDDVPGKPAERPEW